ncbi:MAG: hypothetical protein WA776_18325 [Xanthobacteraceae bacterium]
MKTLAVAIGVIVALCCETANARPLSAAPSPAGSIADVCPFIAAAYSRGNQGKLWGYPDPVDIAGDGKLRHVYVIEQGTAHLHSIIASTKPLSAAEQQTASSEVNFYGSIGQDMVLETIPRIFAFEGAYYVVYEGDGGPYDVVKPNIGELCRFKRHYSPVLSEDHAPALCKQALAGKSFKILPTQKLANPITVEDAETLDLPGPFSPSIAGYAKLKLDPAAAPITVGYFTYDSGAGSGCRTAGVVFLHGGGIEKSSRNTALLAAEGDMANCRGSNAFLIQAGGQSLIEIDGGAAEQQTRPSRLLLRLNGDKIEKVCNVEERATFSPTPAAKAQ